MKQTSNFIMTFIINLKKQQQTTKNQFSFPRRLEPKFLTNHYSLITNH